MAVSKGFEFKNRHVGARFSVLDAICADTSRGLYAVASSFPAAALIASAFKFPLFGLDIVLELERCGRRCREFEQPLRVCGVVHLVGRKLGIMTGEHAGSSGGECRVWNISVVHTRVWRRVQAHVRVESSSFMHA